MTENKFPRELDHAKVLYYTPAGHYGYVYYTTGELADHIRFLAICKYEDDSNVCLLGYNMDYEVVSDSLWGSVDECMRVAQSSYDGIISWIAMN